jgi:hypothetical protein
MAGHPPDRRPQFKGVSSFRQHIARRRRAAALIRFT